MARDDSVSMPGVFGGLMRYNEEYPSRFKLKPLHVVIFVVLLVLFVVALKFIAPIAGV